MSSTVPPNSVPGSAGPAPRPGARRGPAKSHLPLILGLLVGLTVLALVGWKVFWPRIKVMRAHQFVEAATVLEQEGQLREAEIKLSTAVRFAPGDVEVLRAAALFQGRHAGPLAQRYHELLLKTPGATPADRKSFVQWALQQQRTDIAKRELTAMIKADPRNAELYQLLARTFLATKENQRAILAARSALTLQPEDPKSQFLYGQVLALSPDDAAARGQGRRALWGLALGTGEFSDVAADFLMSSSELNNSEIRLLIKDLQSRTNQRPTDVLRIYDLRLRVEPGRTNALVEEAFKSIRSTNSSVEVLARLSEWARAKGQAELVLAQLPADVARTNEMLAPQRALALAEAQRWNELLPVIEDKKYPLNPVLANVLRARMAMANQKESEAEVALKVALQQLPSEPPSQFLNSMNLVVTEANRAGMPLIAISAYQLLMKNPSPYALGAAHQVLGLMGTIDDMRLQRDTVKMLNEQLPLDNLWAMERAWADLLLNERIKESKAVAERVGKLNSTNAAPRFVLALALLREQKAAEALSLIENDAADFEKLPPRYQALYVATLAASQQREAARTYARRVDPKYLATPDRNATNRQLYLKGPERDLIKPSL